MDLTYRIVTLPQQTVVGLSARTRNDAPDVGAVIGGLWQDLFAKGGYPSIPQPADDHSVCVYDNYDTDMTGPYDVTVGRRVKGAGEPPQGMVVKTIPAGRYAEFVIHGHMAQAVIEFWTQAWQLPLDRAYTADFEEYWPPVEGQPAEIHIYLALKG